jgi:molybdopterin converting factor small subunit
MQIQVLFFGATADAAGERAKSAEVDVGTSVGSLVEQIADDKQALRRYKLLFALNQEYVAAETPLKEGDELAIFTAVSGG